MNRLNRLVLTFQVMIVFVTFIMNINAKNLTWLEYDKEVTLKGTLECGVNYGPPYFGSPPVEKDKIQYYLLVLNEPINVRGKGDLNDNTTFSSFVNVSSIQIIILPSTGINIKDKINRKVSICGALFQAHTAHHYTDVLVQLKKIMILN